MQFKNTPEDPAIPSRKPWHTPQCTKKTWQTPNLTAIEFAETKGGYFSHVPEDSSGTHFS
jgi:hypothetical protein